MNHGAASAAVDRTFLNPNVSLTEWASCGSKMRSTTGVVSQRGPSWSRTARPVSRLARSSLVSTATADAAGSRTEPSTSGSVASPITTGTPSARTWPRCLLCSSISTTTTSRPAACSCWATRRPTVPRPITSTWPRSAVIFRLPRDSSIRLLTSTLVTSA